MNKLKTLAVFGLAGAGAAFAGGSLWQRDVASFASLQVQTPGAITCWADPANEPTAENNYESQCYSGTGGWWFGYGFGTESPEGTPQDLNTGTELKSSGAMKLTDDMGAAQNGAGLGDEGIAVEFVTLAGSAEDPSGAGIGFNWRNKDGDDFEGPSKTTEDISGKSGLCLTYKSTAASTNAETSVNVELGWKEDVDNGGYGYNTWVFPLAKSTTWRTVNLPWSDFEKSWSGTTETLLFAQQNAEALKFKYQNKTSNPVTVAFELKELGWYGECDGGSAPIISNSRGGASLALSLAGRSLSLAKVSAPATLQVINMQGAVVLQKALSTGDNLVNLATMPTGVYLLRSVELGFTHKIVLK